MNSFFSRGSVLPSFLFFLIFSVAVGAAPYRVFSADGYVAIQDAAGQRWQSDARTALLPPFDQKLLTEEIICYDTEALNSLMENYDIAAIRPISS